MKLLSTETSGTGAESASDGRLGDGSRALTADSIQWLTREQTFVIVYLVRDNNNTVFILADAKLVRVLNAVVPCSLAPLIPRPPSHFQCVYMYISTDKMGMAWGLG